MLKNSYVIVPSTIWTNLLQINPNPGKIPKKNWHFAYLEINLFKWNYP